MEDSIDGPFAIDWHWVADHHVDVWYSACNGTLTDRYCRNSRGESEQGKDSGSGVHDDGIDW